MSVSGRPVIVTGGASGIGAAISRALVGKGYDVGILDRDLDNARKVAVDASQAGPGRAWAYEVDIANYAAVADAIARFEAATGTLYGLVNNAGWEKPLPFVKTDVALWQRIIDINLYGPLNVTHVALKSLVKAGRGRVVSISSDAGRVGSTGEAVYSACKGGIVSFMKTLARENARIGITCNSVCPGPTDTPLIRGMIADGDEKLIDGLKRAIPLGRLGQPEDYPGIVLFLLSDEASYVTGQTISVSGGLTMHG